MRHISITEASELSDRDRAAIGKTIKKIGLKPVTGDDKREKLYNSARLLRALYLDDDGGISYAEALRKLVIGKTALVEQELKIKNEKTLPIDEHIRICEGMLGVFRWFCLDRENKALTSQDISDAYESQLDFALSILPEKDRAATRRECYARRDASMQEAIARIRDTVERDEHAKESARLGAMVRELYQVVLATPTRENLDALEVAWDACHEHGLKSKEHAWVRENRPEMAQAIEEGYPADKARRRERLEKARRGSLQRMVTRIDFED
jgi:hypothetical protein